MTNAPSVTTWLQRLRAGDPQGAEQLFRRYFEELVRLARSHLQASLRPARDEEDLALSALNSFFRAIQDQRYPALNDRHDLWNLLLAITLNKVRRHARHERAQRRGGGQVGSLADLPGLADAAGNDLDWLAGPEPPPEVAAAFADECRHRLELLKESLRPFARARMDGDSEADIARRLGVTVRTVQRKLRLIRQTWIEAGVD
jgi:DNA-directed RNA polymerase specialized sigma24 family protein